MKKLAFALALFLPLMFVSCGDDNEEGSDAYSLPYMNWGASMSTVENNVPGEFTLDEGASTGWYLMFVTRNSEFDYDLPWQQYVFSNGELCGVNELWDYAEDDEVWAWLKSHYTYYGEEDGLLLLGNNKDMNKCTLAVGYQFTDEIIDGKNLVMAIWAPITDTRSAEGIFGAVKNVQAASVNIMK